MSWNISHESKEKFENDERAVGSTPEDQLSDEAREQIAAAREAAKSLIASQAAGNDSMDFGVYLHGHANPNHVPTPGWANDCVGVSISQISQQSPS